MHIRSLARELANKLLSKNGRHITIGLVCGEEIEGGPSREELATAMGHTVETQARAYDLYRPTRQAQATYSKMGSVRKHLKEAMERTKRRKVVLDDDEDDIEIDLSSDSSDDEPIVVDGDEFFTPGK
jgi:hypothetical protein